MRIVLLMSLFALLFGNSLAQGQESRLPACSTAQLAAASDMQKDFDPVLFAGASIESLDDLLNFSAAHIAWRDVMWAQAPLCDEVFNLGLALDQIAEVIFMNLTLRSAGVADEENPYAELGKNSAVEMARLNEIIGSTSDDGAAASGEKRACSSDERQFVAGDIWSEIVNLLNAAYAVETFVALREFMDLKLEWRADIWPQLPPCEEAYDIATWMYRYSSDLAKIYLLDLFGVPRADNPYGEAYLDGLIQYSEYAQWVDMTGSDFRSLPSCSGTTVSDDLYDALERHHDWTETPHDKADDLPALAAAHIEWRDSLRTAWATLPGCRQAFEIALLTLQITGDAATIPALATSGINFAELGKAYQERVVGAGDRIGELKRDLQTKREADDAKPAVALAPCSDEQLDILFDDLQGFIALREQALESHGPEDLIAYIQALFGWRDLLWTALPGCSDALDIAALMIQTAGDYGSLLALELAGVPVDANPYMAQTDLGINQFKEWQAEVWSRIEGPVATPAPGKTYYVAANGYAVLRSCASVDCEKVGIAAEGEALNVVDDSGDWFEVYIGAGVIGFIPREMMSSEPPATG